MIQLGICFGIAQQSYTLAYTVPDINIIHTRVEEYSNNSECRLHVKNLIDIIIIISPAVTPGDITEPRDVMPVVVMRFREILSSSLRRVQYNSVFISLLPHDRVTLLTRHWAELFVLCAAYWSVDLSKLLQTVKSIIHNKVNTQ